jgi:uncharacterized membrane protein
MNRFLGLRLWQIGLIIDFIALLVGNTVFLLYSWYLFFYASESLFSYLCYLNEEIKKEKQIKELEKHEATLVYLKSLRSFE